MSVQILRDIEALSFLEIDSTESLGFGAKQRVYRFIDSPFVVKILTSKGDIGVEYETDQMEFSRLKYIDRRKSHEYVVCEFEDVLRGSKESVQVDILNSLNLFV